MSKHVLIVSQYYYPEQFRINDLSIELLKKGYKVTVVTGIPNYPQGKFFKGYGICNKRKDNWQGIDIIRLPITPRGKGKILLALNYFSFVFSGWFFTHFTNLRADVVFTYEVSPLLQAKLGNWFSHRRNIPHILYVLDLWPENVEVIGGLKNRLLLSILRGVSKSIYMKTSKILVASNEFTSSIVNLGIDSKKIEYWPQYAEDFYKPLPPNPIWADDKRKVLLYTGNLGVAQGLDVLIRAVLLLKNQGIHEVKVVLVGGGRNKDYLIQLVEKEGLSNEFFFVDPLPPHEIPGLLAAADWVFLSLKDSQVIEKTIPAKLQTYLACSKPILASIGGESAKIILSAGAGLVSSAGDEVGLAQNIIKALSMEKHVVESLALNALEYSMNYFNRSKLIDRLLEIIGED